MSTQQQLISALDEFIVRMPKVELHLHLEGAIQPATLLTLAERNGVDLPARDEAGVAQLFRYHNFHEFLTVFYGSDAIPGDRSRFRAGRL